MYASSMGRWISPDPSGLTHADLGNPQSLNLYNYVGNNPLTRTDLDGLCWKGFQWACNIVQRFDNRFNGYGFQTDDQILQNPNQRSQQKIQQTRVQSRLAETAAAAGFIGPLVKRLSSAQMRAIYEQANPGLKVSFDVLRNRFYDMDHILARIDGGSNEASNIQPLERGVHMEKHAADWARWREAMRSAEETLGEIENAPATREIINDVENVQMDAGGILNTVESGGIPFP
jgi:hypothetical protein